MLVLSRDEHFLHEKTFVIIIQEVRGMKTVKKTLSTLSTSKPRNGHGKYNSCLLLIKDNRAISVIVKGSIAMV